jgi:hypothetical protein
MTNGAGVVQQTMASESWRFSLRQLFLWVFAASLILAVGRGFWFAVKAARIAARRSETRNDVKQLMLGLHMYSDTHKHLPPATVTGFGAKPYYFEFHPGDPPRHSWRFVICPYLESNRWPLDYSKPWTDPVYASWRSLDNRMYCRGSGKSFNTRFMAVTGPDTAWGDGTDPPGSIQDLPTDLILIVETRNSGLHWMEPGDFELSTLPRTINAPDGSGISSNDPVGTWIGLADGSVRFVPTDTPFEKLEPFFTIAGASANDIDDLLPSGDVRESGILSE